MMNHLVTDPFRQHHALAEQAERACVLALAGQRQPVMEEAEEERD